MTFYSRVVSESPSHMSKCSSGSPILSVNPCLSIARSKWPGFLEMLWSSAVYGLNVGKWMEVCWAAHARNKVMCVPSLNFRVCVTCKTQVYWFVYAAKGKGNGVVYLATDVILWLSLRVFYSLSLCLIPSRRGSWPETRPIWTQFSPTDEPK